MFLNLFLDDLRVVFAQIKRDWSQRHMLSTFQHRPTPFLNSFSEPLTSKKISEFSVEIID